MARGWRDARVLLLEYLSGQPVPWRWIPKRVLFKALPPLPGSAPSKRAR